MPITALPTPPTRSDPVNFNSRADAFLSALPAFATEANALQNDVNAKQAAASNSAANAAASELAAAASSSATIWVSGTTYAIGNVRFSPITFLSYRRKTAGAGTTDPSADSTNWELINGTGNVDLSSTQTLTNKTFSTGSVWNGSAVPIANGGTGATTAVNAFTAIKQAASETASGVVELATGTEFNTGADATRAVTPLVLRTHSIMKWTTLSAVGGTAFIFNTVPSWATRVTLLLEQVSLSGTASLLVRVGNASTGIISTGYKSCGSNISSTVSSLLSTTGFVVGSSGAATHTHNGSIVLERFQDKWFANGVISLSETALTKTVSGSVVNLEQGLYTVVLTSTNGSDTFDGSGVLYVMVE